MATIIGKIENRRNPGILLEECCDAPIEKKPSVQNAVQVQGSVQEKGTATGVFSEAERLADEMNSREGRNVFRKELDEIEDKQFMRFVEYVLDNVPESFFVIPSSQTGKYHPADEIGKGGLVLHTKRAYRIGTDVMKRKPFDVVPGDAVRGAIILHDIGKCLGYKSHEVVAHNFIMKKYEEFSSQRCMLQTLGKMVDVMLFLVATHMGENGIDKMNIDYYRNGNDRDMLDLGSYVVQIADYISSRRYVDTKIE